MGSKFNHKYINKSHIDWQEGQIYVIVRCLFCGFGKFIYKYRDQVIYVNSQGKRVPHAEPCEAHRININEEAIQLVERKLNLQPPKFLPIKDVSTYHKGKIVESVLPKEKPKNEIKPDLMATPKEEPFEFKKHKEDMEHDTELKPKPLTRFSFKDMKAKPAPDNPKQLDTPTTDTKPDIIHGVPGVDFKYSEPAGDDDLKDVLPPKQELYTDSVDRVWDLARKEIIKNPSKYVLGVDPAKPGSDVSVKVIIEKLKDGSMLYQHLPDFLKDHPKQPINLVARLEEAVVLIRLMYEEMIMLDGPRTKGMKMANRYLQSPEYRELLKELETQRKLNTK